MTNMLNLLYQKSFRNFLIADIISGFGVGMTTVGANWYLLTETNSNQQVGIYLTINVIAGFLMSPLSGALADRFSRKRVILATFVIRALLISIIAINFYFSGFNIWLMYLLSIISGAGWITYMSASRSYVQSEVPRSHFGSANSFIEISLQVGMFAAGAMSGILLNYTNFLTILIINIILFLLASLLIMSIDTDNISHLDKKELNGFGISGIKVILKQKQVLTAGLLSILPLIITQLFNVSSPDYVATTLNANSVVYGIADMSYGIGGLFAGLIVGILIAQFKEKNLIILFFSLGSIALITLFWWHYISLMYLCTFILGLSNSSLRVIINTFLMNVIDASLMGRSTALWNGLAQLIEIFAASLIGKMNDSFGPSLGFFIMFLIMFVGVLWSIIGIQHEVSTSHNRN